MHNLPRNQQLSGFTILEALIVAILIGIISSFAIPGYSNFIDSQQRTTTLNNLYQTIALARSEAIKRNREVVLCPSIDTVSCTESHDYTSGWIMFVNTDKDRPATRDYDEPIVDFQKRFDSNFLLKSNRKTYSFRSQGIRNSNGTFVLCSIDNSRENKDSQSLILSYTGRPKINNFVNSEHLTICNKS